MKLSAEDELEIRKLCVQYALEIAKTVGSTTASEVVSDAEIIERYIIGGA